MIRYMIFHSVLDFEYNTWLYPSTHGWPEQQANFAHDPKETYNMHAYSMIPQASIEVKMAERISITGCNFQKSWFCCYQYFTGNCRKCSAAVCV